MAEWIVLSLGGGIINSDGAPNSEFLRTLVKLLRESKYSFGIVTGGGRTARLYAKAAREMGANEFEADEIAIISTSQNAALMVTALGDQAYPRAAHNFNEARGAAKEHRIVVMGGTVPGITTDTDAALLAEALHAKRLVNMSNIDGIYDSNPNTNPKARKLKSMKYQELVDLAAKNDSRKAGENFIFDMLACKIIARSKIEAHFVDGRSLEDLKKAIEGKPHNGTVVKE
ncbi:MAG: UMP kinase [Candidatus ainarchaeum sp.]|nr:UMP kinase [Candidatus ainarchaeum sp.]